jgi:hypothetical protein
VAAKLEQIDGVFDTLGALSPPEVKVSRPDRATVLYTIAARNGNDGAAIRFTLNAEGNDTRLSFETRVPHIETTIDGKPKVLSKSKIDRDLNDALRALARAMRDDKGVAAAINSLNRSVAVFALATDPAETKHALALARDPEALAELSETDAAWNQDNVSDYAGEDAAMDDPQGYDPSPREDSSSPPDY